MALSVRGIQSTIFEQAETLEPIGAGIQLSPNASRILFGLGLSSAVNAYASAPRNICVLDGKSSSSILTIPLGTYAEKRYGAPYLLIHRGDLQKVLLEAAEKSPHINIQLGHTVRGFEQTESGVIVGDQAFTALIGADGYRSAIRKHLSDAKPRASGLTAWRSTIDMSAKPALFERASTTLLVGRNAHLVTYPVASGTQLNVVAVLNDKADIKTGFSHWCGDVQNLLETADDWQAWPLFEAPERDIWHKNNVAILGDAAHAMLPFAAQGGAMAIEDAAMLAEALVTQANVPDALAQWSTKRQKRTSKVAALARSNRRIYHLPFPLSTARNFGLKILGGKRLLARQDWIYGFDSSRAKPNSSD